MTMIRAFRQWQKDQRHEIKHVTGCHLRDRNIPIDECQCDCYQKAIFAAGYYSGRGLFPRTRFLNEEERGDRP